MTACSGPSAVGWTNRAPVGDDIDCAPAHPDAYPGSREWSSDPIPGRGGFDWNCDGEETGEYGLVEPTFVCADSLVDSDSCRGASGWVGGVPGCGESCSSVSGGSFSECAKRAGGVCGRSSLCEATRRQRCR
jgi:hypothetical protein